MLKLPKQYRDVLVVSKVTIFRRLPTVYEDNNKIGSKPNFLLHQLISASTNHLHNDSNSYLEYLMGLLLQHIVQRFIFQ